MNTPHLPPLPRPDDSSQKACTTVRLYLAVLHDVSPEQRHLVCEHMNTCAGCAAELRILTLAEHLLSDPPEFAPPLRVDQAVQATIAEWSSISQTSPVLSRRTRSRTRTQRSPWVLIPVAAMVLLLVFLATTHLLSGLLVIHEAFALPAHLSWNGYVLHYAETKIGTNGVRYHIDCYHDLGTGRMRVETSSGGSLDIVIVGDQQRLLGVDYIHHVAQWGASTWSVDDSIFDLAQLRSDLQTHRAFFEGRSSFEGQQVSRIRTRNGLVLLLDMQYRPVNVLRGAASSHADEPIYERLSLLPASQVPSALWNMTVPEGFQMGRLPEGPYRL
jgi:hypothetical protein